MTLKRIFDVTFSIIALALLWPLFVVIAIAIRFSSRGPVIFRQERVGYRGAIFTMLKFRTMKDGSAKRDDYVTPGDGRVTFIGKILRATHLDELPQFWNVVRGEMSMVGPRPMSMDWVKKGRSEIADYSRRFAVMPGITGLVQVRGRPSSLVPRYCRNTFLIDLFYIRHQCFLLDLIILARTFVAVWKRQGI